MIETTLFNMLADKSRKIDFDPAWSTLFRYAAEGRSVPVLHVGEIVSGVDPQGRRFVMIASEPKKSIIFYERYKTPDFKYIIDVKMTKLCEQAFTVTHDIDLGGLLSSDTIKKVCQVLKDNFVAISYIRSNGTQFLNTYLTDFL